MGCRQSKGSESCEAPLLKPGWGSAEQNAGYHILIVDDVEMATELLLLILPNVCSQLGMADAVLDKASSVDSADAKLEGIPPVHRVIVLLDQMMPEKNGDVLVRRWRSKPGMSQHICFISCTGNVSVEKIDMFKEAMFDGIMHKPFYASQCRDVLKRFSANPHCWWSTA